LRIVFEDMFRHMGNCSLHSLHLLVEVEVEVVVVERMVDVEPC